MFGSRFNVASLVERQHAVNGEVGIIIICFLGDEGNYREVFTGVEGAGVGSRTIPVHLFAVG